ISAIIADARSLGLTTVQQHGEDNLFEVLPGANVTVAGPLVKGTNSVVFAGHNVLNVAGNFTSTGPGAVIDLDPSAYIAPGDFVFVGGGATMSLAGPLIKAVESIVSTGSNVLHVDAGTVTTASTLLSFTGSDIVTGSSLVRVVNGGQIIASGTGDALVSITGGTHSIGEEFSSILFMRGRSVALDSDGVGTGQAIQTARTLVEVSGATIRSHAGAIFDTMLFNATAPIFSVSNNSDLRFETDAIRFSDKVRMTSAGPILRLDGSTISANTILNLNN